MTIGAFRPALTNAPAQFFARRELAVLLAASCFHPSPARAAPDDGAEERLIALLSKGGVAGAKLRPVDVNEVDRLVAELAADGGSSRLAAEGIGSWGSWIGAWDVLYTQPGFTGGPVNPSNARLVSARQFVYGPVDTKADLQGIGRDGSMSTECVYAPGDGSPSVLLARSGSFTKLPAYDFRLEFAAPPRAYRLPADGAAPSSLASPRDALGSFELPGGASLREITYLSEQLWISRSGDDGSVVVLGRSEATPLMPPAGRADLTATCAEAVFVRGAVCRRRSLLEGAK